MRKYEVLMTVKTYLGDGAYAEFDGYGIKLTAENGIEATDTIYLEPSVFDALVMFSKNAGDKLNKKINEARDNDPTTTR